MPYFFTSCRRPAQYVRHTSSFHATAIFWAVFSSLGTSRAINSEKSRLDSCALFTDGGLLVEACSSRRVSGPPRSCVIVVGTTSSGTSMRSASAACRGGVVMWSLYWLRLLRGSKILERDSLYPSPKRVASQLAASPSSLLPSLLPHLSTPRHDAPPRPPKNHSFFGGGGTRENIFGQVVLEFVQQPPGVIASCVPMLPDVYSKPVL